MIPNYKSVSRDGIYKVPEYFGYNKTSYYQAEVDMKAKRLEVPNKAEAYVQVGM